MVVQTRTRTLLFCDMVLAKNNLLNEEQVLGLRQPTSLEGYAKTRVFQVRAVSVYVVCLIV